MRQYRQLTEEERIEIYAMKQAGKRRTEQQRWQGGFSKRKIIRNLVLEAIRKNDKSCYC